MLAHLAVEPRSRGTPIALDGACGHAHHFGGFLEAQAAEKAQLDDLRASRIDLRQRGEGVVERQEIDDASRAGISHRVALFSDVA